MDILEKLPKNFFELVEEKKWQLRKEALDALLPLSQTPKISVNGDYNDLIRVLKKFIGKDSNVMLVTLAAQCLAGACVVSNMSKVKINHPRILEVIFAISKSAYFFKTVFTLLTRVEFLF